MDEMIKKENLPDNSQSENAYLSIRGHVIDAQRQVYSAVNAAMVTAYWNIGKIIYEVCVSFILRFQFGTQCVPN